MRRLNQTVKKFVPLMIAVTTSAFALCSFLPNNTYAATLHAGEYLTEKGWGTLSIKNGKDGKLNFSINAIGANGHMCGLDGNIVHDKATLEAMDAGKPCVVSFADDGHGITVTSVEACSYYCGMRARFDGTYVTPTAGCSNRERAKTRKVFKQLYDEKSYADAYNMLQPVLKNCEPTMHWSELGSVRNDLAITQYKLGELAGCRQTLQPLAADAAKSDATIREEYPPTDADTYAPILRATRTNLKLCKNP